MTNKIWPAPGFPALRFFFVLMLHLMSGWYVGFAQQTKKSIKMKDSSDHRFDMSDYIIEENGFVPIPYVITEPALGGFGLALVPVFIKKRPPYLDSADGRLLRTPVEPDITGGILAYTANNTWMMAAFRKGTFVKSRIKYTIGGGYANVNMSYYMTFDRVGEKEFKFNIRTLPVTLQATKRIGLSHWYAGFKYLFLRSDIKFVGGDTALNHLVMPLEKTTIVSQLGALVELDNRDNIFTPDKGMKVHMDVIGSGGIIGSDYDFWRLNYYMYAYQPVSPSIVMGFRLDGQQAFNNPPFYLLPYIDMRGIPANRYQGNADILSELEMRWDFVRRWSLMLYGGLGKAFDEWADFGSAQWVYSYGTGFRYLLARKFKLRVGIDIARGPDVWAYYIVFGSNWLK